MLRHHVEARPARRCFALWLLLSLLLAVTAGCLSAPERVAAEFRPAEPGRVNHFRARSNTPSKQDSED